MPIFLIIALIAFFGATVNAQSALPGDTLYPVKINVNENLRTAFSVGDAANARSRVVAAESRLAEAEKLRDQNKLTAAMRTILGAQLTDEVGNVRQYLAAMREAGQVQTAAAVEMELKDILREKIAILSDLNAQFNPENLDSFVSGRTIGQPVLMETTLPASTTIIEMSEPTVETSTTSGGSEGL
jgi:hypothetical protein